MAKHREVLLSVGLSTVRKEIARQGCESADAFCVKKNRQREAS
jgi:hypothetical protein